MRFREIHGHLVDFDRVSALVPSPNMRPKSGIFVEMVREHNSLLIECEQPNDVIHDFLSANPDLKGKRNFLERLLVPQRCLIQETN